LQPQLVADGGQGSENYFSSAANQNADEQFWSQEPNANSVNQQKFKETHQAFAPNIFRKNELESKNVEKTLKLSKDQVIRGEKRRHSASDKSPKKQQQASKNE
jgi:hypothetical protein